jgi:trimeric autotransporter adhesin
MARIELQPLVSLERYGRRPWRGDAVRDTGLGGEMLTGAENHDAWTQTLPVYGMQMTGENPALFNVSHTCAPWVPVASGCSVRVAYRPTWQGDHSAVLRISAGDDKISRPVTGTGVVSAFTLSPRSLYFGRVPVNTTSPSQTVTVTNTGLGLLPIGTITRSGTNKYQFAISHNCPSYVAVGGRCTVTVRFKPASVGPKSAYLTVWARGGAGGKTVALYGTGR